MLIAQNANEEGLTVRRRRSDEQAGKVAHSGGSNLGCLTGTA